MDDYVKLLGINRELWTYKILLVGAGGIGCELLKTLVFSGFTSIHIIDLDTIEVSNLNRQFLFRPAHVGQSKALTAKESVEALYDKPTSLHAYFDDITQRKYDSDFYRQFHVVLCALDNIGARIHVNRMCMSSSVPFIDSGTAGYLGNVGLISRGETACYECVPKKAGKSYASCTIRNTPSKPIHCVVWAKYLFNQLFSREDQNEDISPETDSTSSSNIRTLAQKLNYDAKWLFLKLFSNDIAYLLSMEGLWAGRRAPVPIDEFPAFEGVVNTDSHSVWTVDECARVFESSLAVLRDQLAIKGDIPWDKENDDSVNFVSAAANLRAHVFAIEKQSKFTIKSLAGNIIPAIASTNAIVAGLVVMELVKLLWDSVKCKSVYLARYPTSTGQLVVPAPLTIPNPDCYACAECRGLSVVTDLGALTVGFFRDKVLKEALGMVFPDVEVDDGSGTILISSDEEDQQIDDKFLSSFGIGEGTRLICDDFFQDFKIVVIFKHVEEMGESFQILYGEEDLADRGLKRAGSPIVENVAKRLVTEEDD